MVAHIATVAFEGIDVLAVDVQVQVANGLPAFTLVGLPDIAEAGPAPPDPAAHRHCLAPLGLLSYSNIRVTIECRMFASMSTRTAAVTLPNGLMISKPVRQREW